MTTNMRRRLKLFDAMERSDTEPAGFAEPTFIYYNRSARPECERARCLLEQWFAAFPTAGQEDLRARFRSDNDHNHAGAFFELYCYMLLRKQGFAVRVHPKLTGGKRTHPDFIASRAGKPIFYLESTVAAQRTHQEDKYLRQLYDYLNRKLQAPNFFVRVSVMGDVPTSTPPLSAICADVQNWIARLDADEVELRIAQMSTIGRALDALPTTVIERKGWRIEFDATPVSKEHRGDPDHKPIGMIYRLPTSTWIDSQKPLLPALRKKAGDYGKLSKPYIIAINSQDYVDNFNIASALFGKQGVRIDPESDAVTPMYFLNGLWTAGGGQFSRVSAVLVTSGLGPLNIGSQQPVLWHNPWAARPIDPQWWQGPQMVADQGTGTMQPRAGAAAWDILGTTPG